MTSYPYYEKDYFHTRCGKTATAIMQSESEVSGVSKPGETSTCPWCGNGMPNEEFVWCSNTRRIDSKAQKIKEILGI